jgi:hypothetical protein
MDHAARDDQLARLIRSTLRRWRRSKDPALRWTAAFAYGYDIGARNPDMAFEELKVLGTPWELLPQRKKLKRDQFRMEESVFHAAGTSVANMFGSGAHHEVLEVLQEWSDHPRWSVRLLALQAVVVLTSMTASTTGTPELGEAAVEPIQERVDGPLLDPQDRVARARWPILIALHDRRSELQRQGAELIRFGLRSREQDVVLKEFEEIFSIAEEEPETALPAVEAFLPLMIKEESDRNRLLDLLRHMRGAWADPLAPDIADRLEEVIREIPVMTGEKVFS